jgi:outer membrane protein insertion porin family
MDRFVDDFDLPSRRNTCCLETARSFDWLAAVIFRTRAATILGVVVLCFAGSTALAQSGSRDPFPAPPPKERAPDISDVANNVARDTANLIAEVRFRGNRVVPDFHLSRTISTRAGRYFDPDQLQQDVDRLWRLPEIKRVNGPYIDQTESGLIITFGIEERTHVESLEFFGNRAITDRALKKESQLEINKPLDLHQVKMAQNRIEELYKEKGFAATQVEVLDVEEVEKGHVKFLIHEDVRQRVWNVEFIGNSFVSDGRLKQFVNSKPGFFKYYGGIAKDQEIEQDILRLETYYKSFGFFNARIGREVEKTDNGRWLTIRYVIDEGPRYKVRNVAFIGNQIFGHEQLNQFVSLKPTVDGMPDFDVAKMNQDVVSLRDVYGSQGYVLSDVQAEPRFLEQPGAMDIVYRIVEGKQYRVGKINVHIQGDSNVTKREVVLNYLSLRPGDLIDARELRNSERRMNASQLFAGANAGPGTAPPRIVVKPPELEELQRLAEQDGESHGSGTRHR